MVILCTRDSDIASPLSFRDTEQALLLSGEEE